jgi:hypothetical protein
VRVRSRARWIWHRTVLLWHALCASFLRIDIHDVPATVDRFHAHLEQTAGRSRPRALDLLAEIALNL